MTIALSEIGELFCSILESNAQQGASTQVPQTASAPPLLELLYSVVDPAAEIRHSALHPSRWRPDYNELTILVHVHQLQKG